jgi:hypothetical protein
MCRVQPGRFPDAIANARDKVRTSGPGPVRPDRVTTDDQGRYEWGQTFELISPTCSPFKKPRGSVQFSVAVGSSAVRSPLSPQSRRQEVFNASRVRFRVSVAEKPNRHHIGKNRIYGYSVSSALLSGSVPSRSGPRPAIWEVVQ